MIRFIIRIDNALSPAHAGSNLHTSFKTLDIDLPELEALLSQGGSNDDGSFLITQLVGAEVLPDDGKMAGSCDSNVRYASVFRRITTGAEIVPPEDMPALNEIDKLCDDVIEEASKRPENARSMLLALTGSVGRWAQAREILDTAPVLIGCVRRVRALGIREAVDAQAEDLCIKLMAIRI